MDFKKFIKFLKSDIIKVGGISVSMPLKSIAQKYANVNHHSSLITKNANTLIFKKNLGRYNNILRDVCDSFEIYLFLILSCFISKTLASTKNLNQKV